DAHVAAQVSGEITEITADEGAAVEAEAVVLKIDPERRTLEHANQEAQVAQANAQRDEAERNLERIERLRSRNAVSQAQMDTADTGLRLARARLEAAQARLGLAERALRDATVTAPFSGLIARRHVNAGEFVSVGQPLFDLVTLDPVEVEFFLPEADSSRVRIGVPVEVRVAPYPDEIFSARVTVISPTIDSQTRTLRVKALIDNADGRLRPGLFARADLGVAERSGVPMVPEDAILQRSDGSVLFRMTEDSRVERIRVETGVYKDGLIEVVSGVAPGDEIVVRGQTKLIHGSRVSVRETDGSLPAKKSASNLPPAGEKVSTNPPGAGG
ncbi:MAG: efflux RND transporter periplasmic adaptor subunit, partial [Myxococcota bacterium]